MIHVYGTSHVSEQSLELIEEKINEHDPEIVALELDKIRLNGLLREDNRNEGPIFIQMLQKFQEMVGSKTGVMPGDEMLYAYDKSINEGREIALIDQNIAQTVNRLKNVRNSEKVKAIAQIFLGVLIPGALDFDYSDIPEDDFLDRMLYEFEFKFPEMHKVLVEERNRHMVEALKKLQRENPESDIVSFVGAAHRKAIEESLQNHEINS